ncbi:MAG: hypothetical protein V4530_16895 [Pseudomonadota bacterium]
MSLITKILAGALVIGSLALLLVSLAVLAMLITPAFTMMSGVLVTYFVLVLSWICLLTALIVKGIIPLAQRQFR